jgi:hypothetical protein
VSWNLPKFSELCRCNGGFGPSTHTEPPTDKTIPEWYKKFQQSGCLCAEKRTGRPRLSSVCEKLFVRSPQKSTQHASRELHSAPPHFHFDVRVHLSVNLADRCTGRASDNESPLLPWPPRSPDLTTCGEWERYKILIQF